MVRNVTSLSRSGLSDWVVQRASAVVLGVYFIWLLGYLVANPGIGYEQWHEYMTSTPMSLFSLVALVAMAGHAWVGLWTVSTDYIKHTGLRLAFQAAFILIAFVYVVWGIRILWG